LERFPATLEPVIRMDHLVLDAMVKKLLGFSFCFRFAVAVADSTGVEYLVDGRLLTLTSAWMEKAASVRAGNRTRDVGLILNILAADGHIPFGLWRITTGPERQVITTPGKWGGKSVKLSIAVAYRPPGVE
jgi:hypothetical protein